MLTRALGWLIGAVVLIGGLVLTASLVVAALLIGLLALAAGLLRGERPTFHFRRTSGLRTRRPVPKAAEVVDVEAREINAVPKELERRDE